MSNGTRLLNEIPIPQSWWKWKEQDHPRQAKGTKGGGEFKSKGGAAASFSKFAAKSVVKKAAEPAKKADTKKAEPAKKSTAPASKTKTQPDKKAAPRREKAKEPSSDVGKTAQKVEGKSTYNAFIDMLNMPYFKNQAAKSGSYVPGHEEAVGHVLEQNGFTNIPYGKLPLDKKQFKSWLEDGDDKEIIEATKDMPAGSFVLQPLGTQSFPDVFIKAPSGKLVALECKSAKDGKPMWNDNLPKPNAYYVMTSEKYNATTMFKGSDVISPEELEATKKEVEFMKKRAEYFNNLAKKRDKHGRGWVIYPRQQFNQAGPASSTNFFTHEERAKCERNVLNSIFKV